MEEKAIEFLESHRLMAISTVRPDGWPQTTLVTYANDGLLIYFVISRSSQKFANIANDQRVAIAIGKDVESPMDIKELAIAAIASEVTDPKQCDCAIDLLVKRRASLRTLARPDLSKAAVMRAAPRVITISDYGKGFGHADVVNLGPAGIVDMEPARADDWGFTPA